MFREPLAPLVLVRQRFDTAREVEPEEGVAREFAKLGLNERIRAGESVALTAGSRGITNIARIMRAACQELLKFGAKPFVVPAMGSHGGGTAEGQRAVLEGYGMTESYLGAPIRSSMEVVEIGRHPAGGPIYFDKSALAADHVGVIGRIKPHTGFTGSVESGLVKMMMIGLGKHQGALEYHRVLVRNAWEPFATAVAPLVLERAPIRFGLAILENARDETALLEGVRAEDFLTREPRLLERARGYLPRLPVDEVDLLIIDEIGKDISGSGADTNVISRKPTGDWNERDLRGAGPLVHRIFVRGLSAGSHGNAAGLGLADFTTDRLIEAMDYRATVVNCLTANHPLAAAVPIHFPTDRECIEAAVDTVGRDCWGDAKVVWIANTLRLEEVALSRSYDLSSLAGPVDVVREIGWPMDAAGNLRCVWEK